MQKTWLLSFLAAAAFLAAPSISSAQASTDVSHTIHFPTIDQVNPCNGEAVVITGTLEVIEHTTIDPSGVRRFSVAVIPHLEGEGSTGVYKLVGVTREHDTEAATESQLPFTQSFTSRYHVLSQGSAPNYLDDAAFRITVDVNGALDIQFEHLSAKCVGG